MNTFVRKNQVGKEGESLYVQWMAKTDPTTEVSKIEATDSLSLLEAQRLFGDYRLDYDTGEVEYVEVKRDQRCKSTGNLFLEHWSDNGERTGRKVPGWFMRPDTHIDTYVFMLDNQGRVVFCPKVELERFVFEGDYPTKVITSYDLETQNNRSEGYIVPLRDILDSGVGLAVELEVV